MKSQRKPKRRDRPEERGCEGCGVKAADQAEPRAPVLQPPFPSGLSSWLAASSSVSVVQAGCSCGFWWCRRAFVSSSLLCGCGSYSQQDCKLLEGRAEVPTTQRGLVELTVASAGVNGRWLRAIPGEATRR